MARLVASAGFGLSLVGCPGQELAAELARLKVEWHSLPAERQATYVDKGCLAWLEKQQEQQALGEHIEVLEQRRASSLESLFFGLGSADWPFTPEHFEASVRRLIGLHDREPLPGHRRYCLKLREMFQQMLLVSGKTDEGELVIPERLRVKVASPCWAVHQGFCRIGDRWHSAETIPLAQLLRNHIFDHGQVGKFYLLELACRDDVDRQFLRALGYVRRSDPKMAVFVKCRCLWLEVVLTFVFAFVFCFVRLFAFLSPPVLSVFLYVRLLDCHA